MVFEMNILLYSILFVGLTHGFRLTSTRVMPEDVHRCQPDPGTWKAHYYIRKYNRTTTVLNCNMTLDTDFDDTLTFILEVKRWSDGGWKNNYISLQRNRACSTFFFILPELAKKILDGAGLPFKCPVTKGSYRVDNLPASVEVPRLVRAAGKFMFNIKIKDTKTDKMRLCIEGVVVTEE